jgi:hypothetical protein
VDKIRQLLNFARDVIRVNRRDSRIDLRIANPGVRIIVVDVAFLTNFRHIQQISGSADSEILFVFRYDQIGDPPWSNCELDRRCVLIDPCDEASRNLLVQETGEFDAITYNFSNGLVVPSSRSWLALCFPACTAALVFYDHRAHSHLAQIRKFKSIAIDATQVAEELAGCLSADSISVIKAGQRS